MLFKPTKSDMLTGQFCSAPKELDVSRSTVTVQELIEALIVPVTVIEAAPGGAMTAAPVQDVTMLGVGATIKPSGKLSVNFHPDLAARSLVLVMVKVNFVMPPTAKFAGLNALSS